MMNAIPTKDADGKDPIPMCLAHRDWLIGYYKVPEMIALRYFVGDLPVQDQKRSEEAKAVKHLRECPKCSAWVATIVPPDMFRRQSRQAKYCCAGMFCAVEEPGHRGSPQITFSLFRGEDPCWQIDGKNAFLRFCPWCGKKLPEKPFIEG
jgi:hypothetical protein